MKETYIDLMERALLAYSDKHIESYYESVRANGLQEHGFPRLTANMGILIARGRCPRLLPTFEKMMDLCCESIPQVKAANDFSVREILCCIRELEKSGKTAKTEKWKNDLKKIVPQNTYNVFAQKPTDVVNNWALFTAVSELFRMKMGLGGSMEFIEVQIESQLDRFDEDGLYMDEFSPTHNPTVYDLVARGLILLLLNDGYRGKHYERLDGFLKKAGLLTLKMQSPTGEIAFGGRSNQFIHNEAWLAAVFEYEAKRYKNEGDEELACTFKSAAFRAVENAKYWLEQEPVYHVKNRFPTETRYGCEEYAYFDKYMITAASFLYAAYLVCDDEIPASIEDDLSVSTFKTTYHFHKLFLKAKGYHAEIELDGDPHYDCSGIGRIHRANAPSPICISVPCAKNPNYHLNTTEAESLSMCPAAFLDGKWMLATSGKYEVLSADDDGKRAFARVLSEQGILSSLTVSEDGVLICAEGEGKIGYALPAFYFDGEKHTEIEKRENTLEISYNGWVCRYKTDGKISELNIKGFNRNGHYLGFLAEGENCLTVTVEIVKK